MQLAVLLLNKILPLFCLPVGLVVGLVLLALWKKKAWPGLLALAVFYVCSLPVGCDALFRFLETRYPEIPVAQAGPADAIVVLGGILGPKTSAASEVNWTESVERFEAGVALVQAGRAPLLVFTGARRPWLDGETTEGAELRRLAIARGVPADKIAVTDLIDNTATEAKAIAALLQANGGHRVLLVTSGWHMPRAALLFRRAGVDFIPFPVDFRTEPNHRLGVVDFLPSAGAWAGTETGLRELYGYAFYWCFRR